jgi:hypothetical protein
MSLPRASQHPPVFAAVKAKPSGRPTAGLDSGCGPASDISGGNGPEGKTHKRNKISKQGKPGLYQTRGGAERLGYKVTIEPIDPATGELEAAAS